MSALRYKKQSNEAIKCYKKVARANPESPEAQYFLGVAYVWAGDEKSTRKQYQLLGKIDYGSAYLLIDVIYHVKPQWFDNYYHKETEESIRKYGEEARELEIQRLSSYKIVASDVDYSAARQNVVEIFGEID